MLPFFLNQIKFPDDTPYWVPIVAVGIGLLIGACIMWSVLQ